jgi:hypothetical protein
MHIEGLRGAKPVHTPNIGHQRLPAYNLPGLPPEPEQQIKLPRPQLHFLITNAHPPRAHIDPQRSRLVITAHRLYLTSAARPAHRTWPPIERGIRTAPERVP